MYANYCCEKEFELIKSEIKKSVEFECMFRELVIFRDVILAMEFAIGYTMSIDILF